MLSSTGSYRATPDPGQNRSRGEVLSLFFNLFASTRTSAGRILLLFPEIAREEEEGCADEAEAD